MTPPEWSCPTLADSGVIGNVACRCGRRRDASKMLEVRTLGVGEAYLCTGCVEDLFRKGVVDRLTFYRRAGAPQEWRDAMQATLLAGPLTRSGLSEEIWGEILTRQIEEALPEEERWEAVVLQAIQEGTLPPEFAIPPALKPPSDFLTPAPAPADLPASPTIPGTGSRA